MHFRMFFHITSDNTQCRSHFLTIKQYLMFVCVCSLLSAWSYTVSFQLLTHIRILYQCKYSTISEDFNVIVTPSQFECINFPPLILLTGLIISITVGSTKILLDNQNKNKWKPKQRSLISMINYSILISHNFLSNTGCLISILK